MWLACVTKIYPTIKNFYNICYFVYVTTVCEWNTWHSILICLKYNRKNHRFFLCVMWWSNAKSDVYFHFMLHLRQKLLSIFKNCMLSHHVMYNWIVNTFCLIKKIIFYIFFCDDELKMDIPVRLCVEIIKLWYCYSNDQIALQFLIFYWL